MKPGAISLAWQAIRLGWSARPVIAGLTVAGSVFSGVFVVGTAWLSKLLIDAVTGRPRQAAAIALAILAVSLVELVVQQAGEYGSRLLGLEISATVQRRLFARVSTFTGLRPFEDPAMYDRLRLAQAAGERAPRQLMSGATNLLRGTIQLAGFVAALAVLWPPMLAATLLAAVPAVIAETRLAGSRTAMEQATAQYHRRRLFYQTLLTDPAAAQEMRLFGAARFLYGRMDRALRHTNRAEQGLDRRTFRLRALLSVLSWLVGAAGMLFAVSRAARGQLSAGDLVLFLGALAGVQQALLSVVGEISRGYEVALGFANYRDVLAAPSDLPSGGMLTPTLRYGIEFRDVWFRYDPAGPWVLRGATFTVPCGQSVGVVGENGAGKSTLVKLMCRFYDPEYGSIHWDGVDLRAFDPESLRARMAAVFQDFVRYDLTAAENIALAEQPDPVAVRTAARVVGADRYLSELPAGYHTLLSRIFYVNDNNGGGPGTLLSGGQWQRVALARSLYGSGGADLLILDEPSSGLDARAEHEIHQALRAVRRGRTSLLISHRLGAIRAAHRIVVLVAGQVTEIGGHDDLMRLGGTYARLFRLQADSYLAPA